MRADATHDEARTLLHLANATKDDAGRHTVVKLYDFFCHAGPNGCHTCLVLELLGSDVSRVLRKTFDEKEGFDPMPYLCTAWILLDTLAWLHQHQVWHLNVRFEKLLVEVQAVQEMDKQELLSLWGGDPITREVLTSNPEDHAPDVPRYLVRAALLDIPFQRDYHKFKLVGLAQSHVLYNPASLRPSPLLTSLEPPPPELIFNETGPFSDVWLAAKTIYKLFVGDVGSGETSPRWIYDAGQASNFYGQWQGRLAQLRLGLGEDAMLAEELGERMAERRMANGSTQDIVKALLPTLGWILEGMLLANGRA